MDFLEICNFVGLEIEDSVVLSISIVVSEAYSITIY
jgi:hypothetical protein